jgi:two-component system, chemotaxis family, chemotaxis protein CheY
VGRPILIVEDQSETREALSALLTAEGYDVVCAANGQEALERLRETEPALILLDYAMPVMDGRQFREAQKRNPRWSSIPVILLTAHKHTSFAARSIDAVAILQKPVDYDALRPLIERHC